MLQIVHDPKRTYELNYVLEIVIEATRPELSRLSKTHLNLYLTELCNKGLTLPVLLSAIDDWNEDMVPMVRILPVE